MIGSKNFKESEVFSFQRFMRARVKQCEDLTKTERDITVFLLNLWFRHANGPKGYIHPGRNLIAKKCGCTTKTASRTLGKLRASGIIIPLNDPKGGRLSTQYIIDVSSLAVFCGCDWVDIFRRNARANVPVKKSEMSRFLRDKMSPCIKNVAIDPSQELETSGDDDV